MKTFIRIGWGLAIGLIVGFMLMGLICDWVGDEPKSDEWYVHLNLIGLPTLSGFGAGLYCAFSSENNGWLLSIFYPLAITLLAALVALIVFVIMLLVWLILNMTVADWLLGALVLGLFGGGGIFIIFAVFER